MSDAKPFADLEPISDAPVSPAIGIAAIALNMSLKYHDATVVKDGTLYQQYKMEGKNLHPLHLDDVFETAKLMEAHLIGASERIAKIVFDAVASLPDDDSEAPLADETNE